ncbi:hypothetical protein [Rhizobium laguerreae]|uniref:hypothetical protein n=1 Tax=Rhizobium laguerreae TaxID=1076926 RepID=UPI001C91D0B1|nr:hypothetical protein [Rhizobium laguerreae]MBY3314706.1 hypothetical protein [Rhizobium laguerreae]
MDVDVYETDATDFNGSQLDALMAHPSTIHHGSVRFSNAEAPYVDALDNLEEIAGMSSNLADAQQAVSAVFDVTRDYFDPITEIQSALRETSWAWEDGELVARERVAA